MNKPAKGKPRPRITRPSGLLRPELKSLEVILTTRCDINCIMCPYKEHPECDLPSPFLKEISGVMPGLDDVLWSGGEVFLLDYFADMAVSVSRKYPSLQQWIVTYGGLIDEKWAELIAENGINLIFSIDGVTKKTYESIRRGSDFGRLRRNIERINTLRNRYGSRTRLLLLATIMRSNHEELESFVDFARLHGFSSLILHPIHTALKGIEEENIFCNNNIYIKRIADSAAMVNEQARKYGIELIDLLPYSAGGAGLNWDNLPKPEYSGKDPFCLIPWQRLFINYDGTVKPSGWCRVPAGNLFENSLREIWDNNMSYYRDGLLKGEREELGCSILCSRLSGKWMLY
ncbi:MAG: radical SAM protein [Elusimicrobia bacterium]|nr:radical SAM protein [Elusimicrobiota bacterium]